MRNHVRTALIAFITTLACAACSTNRNSLYIANAATAATIENRLPCQDEEELIFAGEVEDDFGLSITVCRAGRGNPQLERLTVHYSGEGGGSSVSCLLKDCGEKIEFSHYVRPRFTILSLTWRDNNGEQKLVETFDAEDQNEEPYHSVRHSWIPTHDKDDNLESVSYSVDASTKPLSLLSIG